MIVNPLPIFLGFLIEDRGEWLFISLVVMGSSSRLSHAKRTQQFILYVSHPIEPTSN